MVFVAYVKNSVVSGSSWTEAVADNLDDGIFDHEYQLNIDQTSAYDNGIGLSVSRNRASANTDSPVFKAVNAHTGDDMYTAHIEQNAPTFALYVDCNTGVAGPSGIFVDQLGATTEIGNVGTNANGTNYFYRASSAPNTAGPVMHISQAHGTDDQPACEINNDSINAHGLFIHQDGVQGAGKYGLWVYSNAAQVNSPLAFIEQDNVASDKAALFVQQDSTTAGGHGVQIDNNGINSGVFVSQSSTGTGIEVDNDGTGYGLDIHQDGVLAAGKFATLINTTAAHVNASGLLGISNSNVGSTFGGGPMVTIANDGPASNTVIGHSTTALAAGKVVLGVSSTANNTNADSAVFSVTSSHADSVAPVVEITSAGDGYGLLMEQTNAAAGSNLMQIFSSVAQTASPLTVFGLSNGSSDQNVMNITNAGTGENLFLDKSNSGTVLDINQAVTDGVKCYAIETNIANAGAGNEFFLKTEGSESVVGPFTNGVVVADPDAFVKMERGGTAYYIPAYATLPA